jgi:hypothetical protein
MAEMPFAEHNNMGSATLALIAQMVMIMHKMTSEGSSAAPLNFPVPRKEFPDTRLKIPCSVA